MKPLEEMSLVELTQELALARDQKRAAEFQDVHSAYVELTAAADERIRLVNAAIDAKLASLSEKESTG